MTVDWSWRGGMQGCCAESEEPLEVVSSLQADESVAPLQAVASGRGGVEGVLYSSSLDSEQ